MLSNTLRQAIKSAYQAGQLKVCSVEVSTGRVTLSPISAVLRHLSPHKKLAQIILEDNREVTCTLDHSLFQKQGSAIAPVTVGSVGVGTSLVVVDGLTVGEKQISQYGLLPPDEYTYDLSVPVHENFMLANGILAHNSYSIGGVSLDIEKSSKYESLKQNAETMFEKGTEAKARTTKFIRGLQQPRFGLGVRSAFGPALGRGILSPKSFLVLPYILMVGTLFAYTFSGFGAGYFC